MVVAAEETDGVDKGKRNAIALATHGTTILMRYGILNSQLGGHRPYLIHERTRENDCILLGKLSVERAQWHK
jgi:hypothetical protein